MGSERVQKIPLPDYLARCRDSGASAVLLRSEVSQALGWRAELAALRKENEALRRRLRLFTHPSCDLCGEPMEGEWADGTEMACPHCGKDVTATLTGDGSWQFPPVYDEEAATQGDDDGG